MTSLSVVVPATDRPRTLACCLDAIHAAGDGPDEVIVVEEPPSLSAAAARNAGAARAAGDVVVFVDADVEVHTDVFSRLRAAFDDDPTLAALFGSYDDRPAARSVVSSFRNLLHHHVHQTNPGAAETFWTGLGAVRRETFRATGGFDEAHYRHPSIEDVELGDRLHGLGVKLRLDPTIQGTHLKVWTLRSMLWTDFARRGVPWVALQVRNRRLSSALNLGWRHRLSACSCAVVPGAAVLGAPMVVLGAVAVLVMLNRQLYLLMGRQRGLVHALTAVGLHVLHHLVSIAAVPVGVAVALTATRQARRTLATRPVSS